MNTEPKDFLNELFESEKTQPALQASYQAELHAMLEPKLTRRKAFPGIVILVVLVICTIGLVRNMFVYDPEPLILLSWGVLAAAFSWVSFLIVRDLRRQKHSPKSAFSIAPYPHDFARARSRSCTAIGSKRAWRSVPRCSMRSLSSYGILPALRWPWTIASPPRSWRHGSRCCGLNTGWRIWRRGWRSSRFTTSRSTSWSDA